MLTGTQHTNTTKFVKYFENTYAKLSKQTKRNSMVSECLLPYILQLTRVTDHSATVIDNIFSNNFEYETVSRNIITQIADHFPQIMYLIKINVDHKLCSYGDYDYSNFNEQNFKHDFAGLNWTDMNNASDVSFA